MAHLLTMDEAKVITDAYHDKWASAWRTAESRWWNDFRKAAPEAFTACGSLTRANFLHDQAADFVTTNMDAQVSNSLGFFAQVVAGSSGKALVRFKMLDTGLRTSNHDSDQQDLLDRHAFSEEMMGQLSMFGVTSPPTVLTCGYQLSADEMSMRQLVVVCHWKREVLYFYDLETGKGAEIVQIPGLEEPPQTRVVSTRREAKADSGAE